VYGGTGGDSTSNTTIINYYGPQFNSKGGTGLGAQGGGSTINFNDPAGQGMTPGGGWYDTKPKPRPAGWWDNIGR